MHQLSRDVTHRLFNLENPKPRSESSTERDNLKGPGQANTQVRGQDRGVSEYDDIVMKSVKVEAPPFDEKLDPKIFLDWLSNMDDYFDWYNMCEVHKYKFAKMKLIRQARFY